MRQQWTNTHTQGDDTQTAKSEFGERERGGERERDWRREKAWRERELEERDRGDGGKRERAWGEGDWEKKTGRERVSERENRTPTD